MTSLDSIDLSINISYYYLTIFILLGIVYTVFIYRYTIPVISLFSKSILVVLRLLSVSLIIFLIFEPDLILKYEKVTEPVNLVLLDNSNSIVNRDSTQRVELMKQFLSKYSSQNSGQNNYYSFNSSIDSISERDITLNFEGKRTNFFQIADFVQNTDQHIASVIIVSDGIVNDGSNSTSEFSKLNVPIYTVAIGDSTVVSDLKIQKVIYNDLLYANSPTELRVVLLNKFLDGENANVFLYENSKLIEQKSIVLSSSGLNNVSFTYTPSSDGQKNMSVRVTNIDNEQTYENNRFPFVLNILKNKIRVAIISGSPSTDFKIIKQIINENEKMVASEIVQITNTKFIPDENFEGILDSADVLFFMDFPTNNSPNALIENVREQIAEKNKSFLIMFSELVDFNKLQNMNLNLPVKILNPSKLVRLINPYITLSADPIISTNSENISLWQDLPPIYQTESNIQFSPGTSILVKTKIGNNETSIPLIASNLIGRNRILIINGFGLWKWKIQSNSELDFLYDSFINNSIKWLYAEKQNRRYFVSPIKSVFNQDESVEFRASIYDETLSPRLDAEIIVSIEGDNNLFQCELKHIENGIYEGKIEIPRAGNFAYKSKITLDDKSEVGPAGKFITSSINIENINYVLNKNYLKLISNITSGKSFEIDDFEGLFDHLEHNQRTRVIKETLISEFSIWSNEWILGIIVIFFSIEWFLRKQKGLI